MADAQVKQNTCDNQLGVEHRELVSGKNIHERVDVTVEELYVNPLQGTVDEEKGQLVTDSVAFLENGLIIREERGIVFKPEALCQEE